MGLTEWLWLTFKENPEGWHPKLRNGWIRNEIFRRFVSFDITRPIKIKSAHMASSKPEIHSHRLPQTSRNPVCSPSHIPSVHGIRFLTLPSDVWRWGWDTKSWGWCSISLVFWKDNPTCSERWNGLLSMDGTFYRSALRHKLAVLDTQIASWDSHEGTLSPRVTFSVSPST